MRKILTMFFCAVLFTSFAFAQDTSEENIIGKNQNAGAFGGNPLIITGEIKTGFYWYEKQIGDGEKEAEGFVHNNEDSTIEQHLGITTVNRDQGRFRLNMHLDYGTYGMKVRFQQSVWTDVDVPKWRHAFAYGNFFDNQFKLSVGRLGDSPWATGAPEQYLNELDTQIGLRFEYMPNLPKSFGELNVGLVLNDKNEQPEYNLKATIMDILMESVLGLSYKHDLFNVKLAYRLDSVVDIDFGDQFIFRVEETIIKNFLPGFQIWALGAYEGLRTDDPTRVKLVNWLYLNYDPDFNNGLGLTAEVRLGHDLYEEIHKFYVRPSLYGNFFNDFLTVGAAFEYVQYFGDDTPYWDDAPFNRILIEPMIRMNFGTAYIALIYQHRKAYVHQEDKETVVNAVNLRVKYEF